MATQAYRRSWSTNAAPARYDEVAYNERNLIERGFNKLKHFRRLATRHDRRTSDHPAFIHLAAAMLWLR